MIISQPNRKFLHQCKAIAFQCFVRTNVAAETKRLEHPDSHSSNPNLSAAAIAFAILFSKMVVPPNNQQPLFHSRTVSRRCRRQILGQNCKSIKHTFIPPFRDVFIPLSCIIIGIGVRNIHGRRKFWFGNIMLNIFEIRIVLSLLSARHPLRTLPLARRKPSLVSTHTIRQACCLYNNIVIFG